MRNIEHRSESSVFVGVCWSKNVKRLEVEEEEEEEEDEIQRQNSDAKKTNRLSPVLQANDNADGDYESEIGCTVAKNANS
jgi:hypothetical protein